MSKWTTITVSKEARDAVDRVKLGGVTYSELLADMAESYDPEQARSEAEA